RLTKHLGADVPGLHASHNRAASLERQLEVAEHHEVVDVRHLGVLTARGPASDADDVAVFEAGMPDVLQLDAEHPEHALQDEVVGQTGGVPFMVPPTPQ